MRRYLPRHALLAFTFTILAARPTAAQEPGWIDMTQHAPANTPALSPDEAQKRFRVAPGYEVRLFAAEPQVVNPAAMTWDERGRLWVVELFQYPDKAPPGTPGKDRIKILEDTDNDGRADRVTVFADGLNMATGILIGRDGVFVGEAPDFVFLQDTDKDGRADKRTTLLTGFSFHDRHETLNGFTWGPDGWLYMTHGVFNYSSVRRPDQSEQEGNPFTAVVARYQPESRAFEIVSDGTSNPWGVDFDETGEAFVSACVIDHLFHMAPGGVYVRQSGVPTYPYAYGLLPSIVDHRHHRAAYAGVQIYQGDQYPKVMRGKILMGNIHGNSVNLDSLEPVGAGYAARAERDFLNTDDGWFRPVSEQVGPDGNLWIADWYDRYPCYQNAQADPAGVDRDRGRIWRVVYTGNRPGAPRPSRNPGLSDLKASDTRTLVQQLAHTNVWQRRMAQRILGERRDPAAKQALIELLAGRNRADMRLAALLTLHGSGQLDEEILDRFATDQDPPVRKWVARLSGERAGEPGGSDRAAVVLRRLVRLAGDPDPTVRAGVAIALRRVSTGDVGAALTQLLESRGSAADATLDFLLWRALEPGVAVDPRPFFAWLRQPVAATSPVAADLVHKTMRRLVDTHDAARLREIATFLNQATTLSVPLISATLSGLLAGLGDGRGPHLPDALPALRVLGERSEPAVAAAAVQLAAALGDRQAASTMIGRISDAAIGKEERLAAIRVAGSIKTPVARSALLAVATSNAPDDERSAALRSLEKVGTSGDADAIVRAWLRLGPAVGAAAAQVLSTRVVWARSLLRAVKAGRVPVDDVPQVVRRNLESSRDKGLAAMTVGVFGTTRRQSRQYGRRIEDRKAVVLNGPVDLVDGHKQAQQACLLCHKLYGEGADVGPDLTGVGRSTLDALLANVVNPNQVIGKGYEQVTATTRDGRMIAGRLIEDTARHVRLVGLNLDETVPRKDIKNLFVSDVSVMPEGLDGLADAAFRNLIWYVYTPPQEKGGRVRLELRDKKLTVLARGPGRDGWIELLDYVIDPATRPYIHPLRDPSGRHELTADRPTDHVWQHGVFTGLHKVNGLDFWTEKQGQQHFVRLLDAQVNPDRVSWRSLTEWRAPDGQIVLDEEQGITVRAIDSVAGYTIDYDWTVRAREQPVTIGQHPYGGLSVRMPLHPQHTHLNATGHRHKDTSEKRAAWTTVERPFGDEIWGVALFDHPRNDRHPAQWRVDGQGMINPSPSLSGDWLLRGGQEKTFHYRLQVFRGPADARAIERAYTRYAAEPVAQR